MKKIQTIDFIKRNRFTFTIYYTKDVLLKVIDSKLHNVLPIHCLIDGKILKVLEDREKSFEILLEILPPCVTAIGAITKYLTPAIKLSKMRLLLSRIISNCEIFSKTPQNFIMKRYAVKGRTITIQYISMIMAFALLYTMFPLEPIILDAMKPINKTRERILLYHFKFFIDQKKYYVPVLLYQYFCSSVMMYGLVAADALFLMFIQHACAAFKCLGSYMKNLHTLEENWKNRSRNDQIVKTVNKSFTKEECKMIYLKLKFGIEVHKKIIAFCDTLESTYTVSLAILFVFNVVLISSTCVQVATCGDDLGFLIRYGSLVIGVLFHLFFICLPGQRLINHSENFYRDICDVSWYEYSKDTKVLYQLLNLRSTTISKLTVGKLFTLGMESYLSIVQTAMSYFTMLMSIKQG